LFWVAQNSKNAKFSETLQYTKAPDPEIKGFHALSVATFAMEANDLQNIFPEALHLST